ncbi:flagellar basal-body rod protein FlgG [Pseudobdellovibrio exovorus]|uniref:Flagellar basal-body rod protein FlgG n=1 Tax=Pseudobdellovibrio exovorus JSS TaxID=1184267 RepID=M4VNT6_9BACT|nr:flagellar basal-body rod protein FlgG [Pseudobdellovibrio exovorus]AGH94784.1 flagellar basal-body rod protein FlgG [Pseudobdellovibrio exovorus JSS]
MIKSLNTAATGMLAQQNNMDVISNNIANVNTTGFKKGRAEFEDLVYHNLKDPGAASGMNSITPTGVQTGLGVRTAAIQKDFTGGSAIITRNPLDLQIEGAGFFQVRTPDGEISYTRDGSFKKDAGGRVVDKNGNALIPEIVVPPNTMALEISPSGEVRSITDQAGEPQVLGQIDLASFINPAGLKNVGKNLFLPTAASGQPQQARPGTSGLGYLAQGELEGSNVNIVDEMVNMISAQRAYETNSKVVQTADQMMQTAVNIK